MTEETKLGIDDESALVIWKNTQISFPKPKVENAISIMKKASKTK